MKDGESIPSRSTEVQVVKLQTSGSHEVATTPVYGRELALERDSDSIRSASQSPVAIDPPPAIKKPLRCHYAQEAKNEGTS